MKDFETKITVRYAETDQMGVAHHSVYNQKNELINIGASMHAWTGTDLKIMNLKKKFPEIYAKIEAIVTKE